MLATEASIKDGISLDSTGYVSISGPLRPRLFSKTCAPQCLLNLEPSFRGKFGISFLSHPPSCFASVALTFSCNGS